MDNKQRLRRLTVAAAVAALAGVAGGPGALAAGDDGVITGGGGENPREAELKRESAPVQPGPLKFGAESYEAVSSAASSAAGSADCDISADAATYLTLSPTWPEVAGNGEAPSPMTLSRYDDQTSLADPEQRGNGLFFNPGVGMWQLDSAGLGTDETAASAIDSVAAAKTMAPYIVDEYCSAVSGGSSAAEARSAAWTDWHACDEGACEDVYQRLSSDGLTTDTSVKRRGGAAARECTYEGTTYDCLYVDPSKAQGADAWTAPDFGPAPLPDPFYVFTYTENGTDYEVRYWLQADSGASEDVSASRALGTDARDRLSWAAETDLCDTTAGRGNC